MINEKLAQIQQNLKAPKNQRNSFGNYNYRSCEDILEAAKPHLAKQGCVLTLSDSIVLVGDRVYVQATARITDGSEEISTTALAREEETKKGMDAAQITGSASSYARKYALNGLFCIDDTKDADYAPPAKTAEPVKNPEPVKKPDPVKAAKYVCADCGKELEPYCDETGKPVSLRAHAYRAEAKFGRVLCLDCINKL